MGFEGQKASKWKSDVMEIVSDEEEEEIGNPEDEELVWDPDWSDERKAQALKEEEDALARAKEAASQDGANEEGSRPQPPPADVRSMLAAITEGLFSDSKMKQSFKEGTSLFVLLGQAHGFVNEGKFDEAYGVLVTLQARFA